MNDSPDEKPKPPPEPARDLPLKKEVVDWVKKLAVPVVGLAIAVGLVVPLKWALGIYTIEAYLETIQSELSKSEDTVYTYLYEIEAPELVGADAQLEAAGWNDGLAQFVASDFSEINRFLLQNDVDDATRAALLAIRSAVLTPKRRVFRFSASENAHVLLDYAITCLRPDGTPFRRSQSAPIRSDVQFEVRVNEHPIPPHSDREGRRPLASELDQDTLTIAVDTDYNMRRHSLVLSIFGVREDETTLEDRLTRIEPLIAREVERCTLDAMIIVRDIPASFEQRDAITWLRERVNL